MRPKGQKSLCGDLAFHQLSSMTSGEGRALGCLEPKEVGTCEPEPWEYLILTFFEITVPSSPSRLGASPLS